MVTKDGLVHGVKKAQWVSLDLMASQEPREFRVSVA